MTNILKKALSIVSAAICAFGMSVSAFAANENTEAVEYCSLTITIKNNTNGTFKDDLKITLAKRDGTKEYPFRFTSKDYTKDIVISTRVEKGEYAVSLLYENKEDFSIKSANNGGVSVLNFIKDSYNLNWQIVRNTVVTGETGYEIEGTAEERKEALELWKNFLNAVSVVETDEKYSTILELSNSAITHQLCDPEKIVISKDELANMPDYERFLWNYSYISPYFTISETSYGTQGLDKWLWYGVNFELLMLDKYGTEEMKEAYKALMVWDYYYFVEHGKVFNFIYQFGTDPTAFDESMVTVSTEETVPEETAVTEETAVEETTPEESTVAEAADNEDNGGIWGDFLQSLKDNIFSLILLVILIIGVVVFIVYRKKKTIDE